MWPSKTNELQTEGSKKVVKVDVAGVCVVVDAADEHIVRGRRWHRKHQGSVYLRHSLWDGQRHRHETLHRLIAGAPPGVIVDHINGDPLDNRRSNLRICSAAGSTQNRRVPKNNTSGYRGVSFQKDKRRWRATIRGKLIGYFKTPKAAARAYDRAARRLFGEFATLNFPKAGERAARRERP